MNNQQYHLSSESFQKINKAPTNNSTTKQAFSFSKSHRFSQLKPECPESTYGGDSIQKKHAGTAIGFGARSDFTKNLKTSPSSNKYRLRTFWEENAEKNKGPKFALSRDKVVFSSYVPKEQLAFPAPTSYENSRKATQTSAPKYSVRLKTSIIDKKLTFESQNNNPGPGTYENPQLSHQLSVNNISKYQNIIFSQPKSKRFVTSQTLTPGPGRYDDILMLSKTGNYVLSNLKGGTKGKFDAQKRESLFEKVNKQINSIPGPGSYQFPSEFGHYGDINELRTLRKNKESLQKIELKQTK